MNKTVSSSRENILKDDSFRTSPSQESVFNSTLNFNSKTNLRTEKSTMSNRISSAVSNTREASNKLNVDNTAQYPVSVPKEVEYLDDFIVDSRNATFINDNTEQENLSENGIIDDLVKTSETIANDEVNVKRPKTAQFLSPFKQARNLNSKLDKLPSDNDQKLPVKTLTEDELAQMEIKAKNAKLNKIPPLKPISNGKLNKSLFESKNEFSISMPENDSFQTQSIENKENKIENKDKKLIKMYEEINKDINKEQNSKVIPLPVTNTNQVNKIQQPKQPSQPIIKDNPNHYIEVRKENPNQMKYLWISLIIIAVVLATLLAIVLGVVLSARSNSVAQMLLQIPTLNTTNTTIMVTTTTTTTTTTLKTCELTTTPTQTQLASNSYSCPNNALYLPSFITQSNSYSYGYVINQQIVCANSILNLVCPSNQYIHIYSAYFGIQSNTVSSCITSTPSTPNYCFNKAAFDKINSTCESTSNCTLIATPSFLQGEPCQSYSKQLMVQYQCVDSNTLVKLNQCAVNKNTSTACPYQNDPTIQTQQWCEPSIMQIQCQAPSVIQIVCAYYGIDSTYQCPGAYYTGAPTSCYSSNSKQLVISRCEGKSSCSILGSPNYQASNFTDPCNGFGKILYIQYRCVNQTTNVTSTTSSSISSTLPYCQNYVLPSGSCSSVASSSYVPSFLSPNQTSFTYPILQQIACLGSKVNLVCPSNSVIHIYSAYFGIQSSTSVSGCFLGTLEQPAMCYYTKSFSYINTTCEYQQSCLISADTTTLGDACPNSIEKQLLIQYQCVDPYALNTTINNCNTLNTTAPLICPSINVTNTNVSTSNLTSITSQKIWCDGTSVNITCANNRNITILCAYYGLHPSLSASCGISSMQPDIPVCYFKSSFTQLNSLCSKKNSCTISDPASIFMDPCNGQTKALFVQWQCS